MTIIEQSGSVVVDVRDATKTLCVYEHYIGGGDTEQIIFVNVCSLVDVHKLSDARINTEWARIFTGGGSVGVRVLATGMDRRALLHWARQYIYLFEIEVEGLKNYVLLKIKFYVFKMYLSQRNLALI